MNTSENFYTKIAAAFIRGRLPDSTKTVIHPEQLWSIGLAHGLKLHKFKRSRTLPRVAAVLGMLNNIQPQSLLDIGSGRGVFLWPLLASHSNLSITAIDILQHRVDDINAIHQGGYHNITAYLADATSLPFTDNQFDVVTALEAIEHIPDYTRAIKEIIRVAKRHVIFSVPSKPDDNPEHLRVLSEKDFDTIFAQCHVRAHYQYVLNHRIVFLTKQYV